MAKDKPGRNHRKGLSLVDLMQRFPDDATAEHVVRRQSLAFRSGLPPLRLRSRPVGRISPQVHALPLP